jgi:hypothetical protein
MLRIKHLPILSEFPSDPANKFSNSLFVAALIVAGQVD